MNDPHECQVGRRGSVPPEAECSVPPEAECEGPPEAECSVWEQSARCSVHGAQCSVLRIAGGWVRRAAGGGVRGTRCAVRIINGWQLVAGDWELGGWGFRHEVGDQS
jgi:hypothetical protein